MKIKKNAKTINTMENGDIEYILCFPPRKQPSGNVFNQICSILQWKPVIENQYAYQTRICLFMKCGLTTAKYDRLTQLVLQRKIRKYAANIEKCEIYQMQNRQDYPYSLRLYLIREFFEHLNYEKRMRLGILDGATLEHQDLIALVRQYYDRMNYLTIFSTEPDVYRELAEEAWEQYGLAITITQRDEELKMCDCILDCTMTPLHRKVRCKKGCFYFFVWGNYDKIRSLRIAAEAAKIDSCANVLDRAFHNKV